jgi:putative nucleotidyltransferase with HDIG domain
MAINNPEPANLSQNQAIDSKDHQTAHEAHHDLFPSERSFFNWLTVCAIGFASLVFALSAHHIYNNQFHVGDVADHDLLATHASLVVDEAATAKAREAARHAVMPVFKANKEEDRNSQQKIADLLNGINKIHATGLKPLSAKSANTVSEYQTLLSEEDASFLSRAKTAAPRLGTTEAELTSQREALKKLKAANEPVEPYQVTIALLVPESDFGKYNSTVQKASARILRILQRLPENPSDWTETAVEFLPDQWNQSLRLASAELICSQLRPNMEVDLEATERKAATNAAAIKPVMKQITVGELIAKKNTAITAETAELLQVMGISEGNRWPVVLGLGLSLAAAVSLVALFLFAFEQKHLFSTASVGLMYTVSVVVFAMSALWGKSYPQIVPLPAAALILTIFLGQRVAAAVTVTVAIFLGVDGLIDMSNLVALATAAGAAIGFYSKKRHALMSTGLIMALAQGLGFVTASLMQGITSPTILVKGLSYDFVGGIILAIVSIGSLPFLESIFGMLTPFRLAELTDADQPLLRKLEENAPGTYQHSLAVANLAEAGARDIGADVNLVRAGAFYHDVGKMVRPKYFIENQLGDKNPHDSMSPEDSRARVLAHVTDGIALAQEYGLPKAVQDFIPMHQGTSLMAYFYHKACLRDGTDKVDPEFYRYPGPKPQSKETSIVMLADVSEAVTHSMKDPSQEEVEEAMTKVFQNRWDDGQFNESTLTYTELQKVKKAFVHVWRTLHHERLKYPSTTTGRMAVPPEAVPVGTTQTLNTASTTDDIGAAGSGTNKPESGMETPPPDSCC